jgi:hypothetical protein
MNARTKVAPRMTHTATLLTASLRYSIISMRLQKPPLPDAHVWPFSGPSLSKRHAFDVLI